MSPVPLDVPFIVANEDGNFAELTGRARARSLARRMSADRQRAVVVQRGVLIACASNGRLLPAKWFRRWPAHTQRQWLDIAPTETT
jgi:hypothetical protein